MHRYRSNYVFWYIEAKEEALWEIMRSFGQRSRSRSQQSQKHVSAINLVLTKIDTWNQRHFVLLRKTLRTEDVRHDVTPFPLWRVFCSISFCAFVLTSFCSVPLFPSLVDLSLLMSYCLPGRGCLCSLPSLFFSGFELWVRVVDFSCNMLYLRIRFWCFKVFESVTLWVISVVCSSVSLFVC